MILFMLMVLVLARDNGMIISPLCWVLFGYHVWLRVTAVLLKVAKERGE